MSNFASDVVNHQTPPVLPPKPGSHETSRIATPASAVGGGGGAPSYDAPASMGGPPATSTIPDPGDQWLPQILQDKSKYDLAGMLGNPALLNALTHSPDTIHPSLKSSHDALSSALSANVDLASQLTDLESHLARQRAATQAQLLSTQALERQWRQKQSDMDHALAPFSPAALYQQLGQGVQEQAMVCQAMEESFLDGEGDGGALASEREVADWIRRYREARVQFYLRQERKERWDEGRVGGWR